ncbi:MAG: nucleoside monophosphate kinase [Rhabdochlamydiaceae bacterium]
MISSSMMLCSERTICLIDYGDQVLVAKNKTSPHWILPGGILRQNEDFIQAVFRSVMEKTEIDLRKEDLAYCGKSKDSKQNQILHVFHATLKERLLHSPQETDLKWVAKDKLQIIDTNERGVFSEVIRLCQDPHIEAPSHPSRVVINLFGTVGTGKGTQGKKLLEKYRFASLSLGDLYRTECREKTPIGNLIGLHHEKFGAMTFAPNEIAYGLVLKSMANPLCKEGVVLDGFPRTAEQGLVYNKAFLRPTDTHIPIYLSVDEQDIYQRLETRKICSQCELQVRKEDKIQGNACPSCQGVLVRRSEDAAIEKLQQRLQFFKKQIPEVISTIALRDRVFIIHSDSSATPDDVFMRIDHLIQSKRSPLQNRYQHRSWLEFSIMMLGVFLIGLNSFRRKN